MWPWTNVGTSCLESRCQDSSVTQGKTKERLPPPPPRPSSSPPPSAGFPYLRLGPTHCPVAFPFPSGALWLDWHLPVDLLLAEKTQLWRPFCTEGSSPSLVSIPNVQSSKGHPGGFRGLLWLQSRHLEAGNTCQKVCSPSQVSCLGGASLPFSRDPVAFLLASALVAFSLFLGLENLALLRRYCTSRSKPAIFISMSLESRTGLAVGGSLFCSASVSFFHT